MLEAFKDVAKIGMGAIWLSRENLKKLTDDLVQIGKASKEEGERLFQEFDKSREEYKKKLESTVADAVKRALNEAGLARKVELDELRRKIEDLEAKLGGQAKPYTGPDTD